MTDFTSENYLEVKKEINKFPMGISRAELIKRFEEKSAVIGFAPRSLKPPGRDKIISIVNEGKGKDWSYKLGGGKGVKSIIKPIKTDPLADLAPVLKFMNLGMQLKILDELWIRRNKKFSFTEILEFIKIRDIVLGLPMSIYYGKHRHTTKQEHVFKRIKATAISEIEKINKIEITQRKHNKKFADSLKHIENLNDISLLENNIKNSKSYDKKYLKSVNYIQTKYNLKK